jgi:hypothetical protein
MKKSYSAPKLVRHGDVAEITQILGNEQRTDYVFQAGQIISGNNDLGSRDITLP